MGAWRTVEVIFLALRELPMSIQTTRRLMRVIGGAHRWHVSVILCKCT